MPRPPPSVRRTKHLPGTRNIAHFVLTHAANARVTMLAKERGQSRSDVVESLIMTDYPRLFALFRECKSLTDIVIETGFAPQVVREAHQEYQAGWDEPSTSATMSHARVIERAATERRLAAEALRDGRIITAASRDTDSRRRHAARLAEADAQRHAARLAAQAARRKSG